MPSRVAVCSMISASLIPLAAVYVITWVLQTTGQAVFWRMKVSAAVGFIAMGIFVVLVAVRLFGQADGAL